MDFDWIEDEEYEYGLYEGDGFYPIEDDYEREIHREIDKESVDLINQDYNLDSPLNPTFIKELIKVLKTFKRPDVFKNKIENEVLKIRANLGKDFVRNISAEHPFHKGFSNFMKEYIQFKDVEGVFFSKTAISDLIQSISEIMGIIFHQEVDQLSKKKIKTEFERIFSKGEKKDQVFHKWYLLDTIVKTRNYLRTNGNLDQFSKSRYSKLKVREDNTVYFKMKDCEITGLIFPETYYVSSLKMLITHDELLMIKDVCFARWITSLVITLNLSCKYDDNLIQEWNSMVEAGDDLLSILGNRSYDSLKMLETLCLQRWVDLAEDEDFLRLSEKLRSHIEKTLGELCLNDFVKEFFSKLRNSLSRMKNPDDVAIFFGSFRIWGHPHIEVEEGLKSLKELVRRETIVDEDYASLLASDLAKKCLNDHFLRKGVWGVDKQKISKKSPFFEYIMNDVWPNKDALDSLPDIWDKLPITKIYEVPRDINLSTLYSDKSHSENRDVLFRDIKKNPNNPIKSKKVLETLLSKELTPPDVFLEEIATNGLNIDDLIIGLREKEREMKIKGRFFTLMSWKLREYIVLTEYLIKKFFLPHFKGITMADGLTTVMKKIIKLTSGQSGLARRIISIANHIDYEKWNNLQRGKSVTPVFRVMDRLMGFKGDVIARTHPFFEKTLVYFAGRPDKLELLRDGLGNVVCDESKTIYAWNGQKGGFEGLRQKGWTVCGALLVERESRHTNVKVNLLAQGDNQIIVTNFKRQDRDFKENDKKDILNINNLILERILRGAERLGLSINRDETMSSSRFFIYGKVPIYRGNFLNLEGKKWSRATSVSNDQLPTSANVMGAITTTAIGSLQFEEELLQTMILYSLIGCLCLKQSVLNNPIIGLQNSQRELLVQDILIWLFLDKSIGGYTGMAPTRLMIRQFPDPVTESLSFWNLMRDMKHFRSIYKLAFNPVFSRRNNYESLIDNPTGLNIVSGASIENALKKEVRNELIKSREKIKNQYIKSALNYSAVGREPLITFLISIEPCFPRFLSEFKESSEVGLSDNIIGLIQNSRTIRNIFKRKFSRNLINLVKNGEKYTLTRWMKLYEISKSLKDLNRNLCTSDYADRLRSSGWKRKIVGITIPHPSEYLRVREVMTRESNVFCGSASDIPRKPRFESGPLNPYLGSKTSETTSVINHWDKEVKNPLSYKAFNLLRAINWFVDKDSMLGESIMRNAIHMSGLDRFEITTGSGNRTGTAIHRFSSSRVSNGGFIPMSPNLPRWMFVTAECLGDVKKENYDFMYQATMIYAQNDFCLSLRLKRESVLSYLWSCESCLRKVDDIKLESKSIFDVTNISKEYGVKSLIIPDYSLNPTDLADLLKKKKISEINEFDLDYHVGKNLALMYALQILIKENEEQDASLFSNTIRRKIRPEGFMIGFLDGLRTASILAVLRRYRKSGRMDPDVIIKGTVSYLIGSLRENQHAVSMFDSERLRRYLILKSKFVPPSYPTSVSDMQNLILKSYHILNAERSWGSTFNQDKNRRKKQQIVFFSDSSKASAIATVLISNSVIPKIISKKPNLALVNKMISKSKGVLMNVLNGSTCQLDLRSIMKEELIQVDSEVRHSLSTREGEEEGTSKELIEWGKEPTYRSDSINIILSDKYFDNQYKLPDKKENPIISGLRVNRLPTGAHYKMRSLLIYVNLDQIDLLYSIGDGSGGCGSAFLRSNAKLKVIHNSLVRIQTLTNGVSPQLPSGYSILSDNQIDRLLNREDYWKIESDLSLDYSWNQMAGMRSRTGLKEPEYGIFCDAEVTDDNIQRKIDNNLVDFIRGSDVKPQFVIWKVYDDRLMRGIVPRHLGMFRENVLVKTEFTSAYSYESYIISKELVSNDIDIFFLSEQTLESLSKAISRSFSVGCLIERSKRIIKNKEAHKGIPMRLIQNPMDVLCDYMYTLGVRSDFLNKLMTENKSEVSMTIIEKAVLEFFNIIIKKGKTCKQEDRGTLLPIPTKVMQFEGFLSSIFLMCGLYIEDEEVFRIGEKILNKGMSFAGRIDTRKGRSRVKFNSNIIEKTFIRFYMGESSREHCSSMARIFEMIRLQTGNKDLIKNSLNSIKCMQGLFNDYSITIGKRAGAEEELLDPEEFEALVEEDDMEGII